jgi:transposase
MAMLAELVDGVIGVDTHRDTLTAAAVSHLGGVLAQTTTSADAAGYQQLLGFANRHVPGRRLWAVEGAGSFGAGLTVALQHYGEQVVEVGRPKRPAHRSGAKSDALDAVRAAREVLGHDRPAIPRRRGEREALRALLTTRRSATLARVAAIGQPRGTDRGRSRGAAGRAARPTHQPPGGLLRLPAGATDQVAGAPGHRTRPAGHRPAHPVPGRRGQPAPGRAHRAGPSGRSLAAGSPRRRPLSAAQVLVSWSHAGRFRSEAAFAALAGINPIPACSGQVTRYRLNRGGDRQLNRALHTILLVRLRIDPDTRAYMARRAAEARAAATPSVVCGA